MKSFSLTREHDVQQSAGTPMKDLRRKFRSGISGESDATPQTVPARRRVID
jgi:hypothetical protein